MLRIATAALLLVLSPLHAQDVDEAAELDAAFGLDEPAPMAVDGGDRVAKVATKLRPSLVVVTQGGRTGGASGTGTGFVISEDGLIATCAHVIAEGRPVNVRFEDGTEREVTAVHAWDAKMDLAVLRVDAKGLTPIPLAEPDVLKQGTEVVTIGNPHGFEYSVVGGFVSALRAIDERELIQVAMPIEPGNSGGPLVDMEGKVHGLITMKSTLSDNVGFAVRVGGLHKLLEKPNTVPMDKWLTIGRLDPKRWKTLMGSRWTQRAGRITAAGAGAGFGGRSLCIDQRAKPAVPYEIAVEVKLDDEGGAAGLAFESDGGDRHYGFYPSAGNLRLTRFDGPDVLSWTILDQLEVEAYRPNDWNRLRVRVEEEQITAWVNGEQVLQRAEKALRGGSVGLAKFRGTEPTFRRFAIGENLAQESAPPEQLAAIEAHVATLQDSPNDAAALAALAAAPELARRVMAQRIQRLSAQAASLKEKSAAVHARAIATQIDATLDTGDDDALLRAALLLAKLDNAELDVDAYVEEVERMAGEVSERLGDGEITDAERVAAVSGYLFEDNGFHGSREDYYNRSNSYLNEVIDDREGLPVTLSLLFVELARRAGADAYGLPLPGHFVVYYMAGGERQLVDPFDGGAPLAAEDAQALIEAAGYAGTPADFPPAEPRGTIQRMLNNLKTIAIAEEDTPGALRYVDTLLTLDPEDSQQRLSRALLNIQNGTGELAKPDLEWLFEKEPEGIYLDRLRELYDRL